MKAVFAVVVSIAAWGGSTACYPQTQQTNVSVIRQKNMPSVLYLHVVMKASDGTATLYDDSGTGFIVSELGYVLTANHLIPPRNPNGIVQIEGRLASNPAALLQLEVITRDEYVDLALLALPDPGGTRWQPVTRGDAPSVPDDAPLYALGFEMNRFSSSQGSLRNRYGPGGKWVTSLVINHGDSGGPVFDLQGKLVAIASGGYDGANAITVVTPENLARGLLQVAGAGRAAGFVSATSSSWNGEHMGTTFTFFHSVPSEVTTPQDVSDTFCVPSGYVVRSVEPTVTTSNGPSHLVFAKAANSRKPNCIDVAGRVAGLGVDRVGPIVVNETGNGWLGVNVAVIADKAH